MLPHIFCKLADVRDEREGEREWEREWEREAEGIECARAVDQPQLYSFNTTTIICFSPLTLHPSSPKHALVPLYPPPQCSPNSPRCSLVSPLLSHHMQEQWRDRKWLPRHRMGTGVWAVAARLMKSGSIDIKYMNINGTSKLFLQIYIHFINISYTYTHYIYI